MNIYPFQTIVEALPMTSLNNSIDFGPASNPIQFSGIPYLKNINVSNYTTNILEKITET